MYSIADVDNSLKLYISNKDVRLTAEGKQLRVPIVVDTPDVIYAKKKYPSIYVISGYLISPEDKWQGKQEITRTINTEDDRFLDVVKKKLINLSYWYKVGYMAEYREHSNILDIALVSLFNESFSLPVTSSDDTDTVTVYKDSPFYGLNENKDEMVIYRKEVVLKAHILIEETIAETLLRPFTGLSLTISSKQEETNA